MLIRTHCIILILFLYTLLTCHQCLAHSLYQVDAYPRPSSERLAELRATAAEHAHACLCDHVARRCGRAARHRAAAAHWMRPFRELTEAQRAAFVADVRVVSAAAAEARLELRHGRGGQMQRLVEH